MAKSTIDTDKVRKLSNELESINTFAKSLEEGMNVQITVFKRIPDDGTHFMFEGAFVKTALNNALQDFVAAQEQRILKEMKEALK